MARSHSLLLRLLLSFLAYSAVTMLFAGTANAQDYRTGFPEQLSLSPTGVNLQKGNLIRTETYLAIGSLKWGLRVGPGASMYQTYASNTTYYKITFAGDVKYSFKLAIPSGNVMP